MQMIVRKFAVRGMLLFPLPVVSWPFRGYSVVPPAVNHGGWRCEPRRLRLWTTEVDTMNHGGWAHHSFKLLFFIFYLKLQPIGWAPTFICSRDYSRRNGTNIFQLNRFCTVNLSKVSCREKDLSKKHLKLLHSARLQKCWHTVTYAKIPHFDI